MLTHDIADTDIAIIGMSGRFPGARNIEAFWRNLCEGVECISSFTEEQMRAALIKSLGYVPEDLLSYWLRNPDYVRAGAALNDIDQFDAAFFGYMPAEAERLDPQQRFFLECSWEALENAGYDAETYKGLIGVYAGAEVSSYHHDLQSCLFPEERDLMTLTGNSSDYLTSRVSYKLNLKGPSYSVQSACSTSLMAVHVACQGLKGGECDMALAGGVVIYPTQEVGYVYQEGAMVSPDGHCRPFDKNARGTVLAHGGVGVVVLKRLADALADGDTVYAVIKGSATNNDGTLKNGFTAPSINGQARVVSEALFISDVAPETLSYIEAHGTATPLGDSIEMAALTQAFRRKTQRKQFCALGSLKSNLGHLGAANGVAAVIKVALALQRKQIPASLNYEEPNPQIDFAQSPFYVNQKLTEWKSEGPRRAGINGIAIGGSNVHLILEEAPVSSPVIQQHDEPQVLVVSAKTPSALEMTTTNLLAHLKQHPLQPLVDVAYTLQVGRKAFACRRMVVCRNVQEAIQKLESEDRHRSYTNYESVAHRSVTFLFPGWGSSEIEPCTELYQAETIFHEEVNQCAALLKPRLGIDIGWQFFAQGTWTEATRQLAMRPAIEYALVFTCSYALTRLWQSWGVQPAALIGYGPGEYMAAYLSGVLTLEQALEFVCLHGHLLEGKISLEQAEASIKQFEFSPATIPYLSTITGKKISNDDIADKQYWSLLLQQGHAKKVHVPEQEYELLLEVGPGCRLTRMLKEQITGRRQVILASLDTRVLTGPAHTAILTALGQLWLKGVSVNWADLHKGTARFRVPLPTYPFERQRYWLYPTRGEGSPKNQPGQPEEQDTSKRALDQWFYLPSWKRSLPQGPSELAAPTRWLVFEDPSGVCTELRRRLVRQGHKVVTVVGGEHFMQLDERTYALNPQQPGDYATLLEALAHSESYPERIVHCWGITESRYKIQPGSGDIEQFETAQTLGFYSLIYLAQALGDQNNTAPLVLWVVTNNMQEVSGEDLFCPEKATILGPCRVIPEEYPHISCCSVDVAIPVSGSWQRQRLIEQLLTECQVGPVDAVMAYRGDHRYIQTFEQVQLPGGRPDPRLCPQGTYFITGGLGGIALTLAEYLARQVKARLALVDFIEFPERERWNEWLHTHNEQEKISQKIRSILAMEDAGAEVLVIRADISDVIQMREAIEQCKARFGMPQGIIHAAGMSSGRIIQLSTRAATEQLFAPTIKGAVALGQMFHKADLDFFMLCSSIRSIIGGFGQVSDCAANAFIDAFASYYKSRTGVFTQALNWDAWKEVGMAAEMEVHPAFQQSHDERLEQGIVRKEGCEVFIRALASNTSQVIVSTTDLLQQPVTTAQRRLAEGVATPARKILHPRPALAEPYVPPSSEIEQVLAETWQELFGIDKIGVNDHFYQLGGHSLLAIKLAAKVNALFPVEISLARIIDAHTIAALATLVEDLLLEKLTELSDEEVQQLLQQNMA